jgi:peptidoglycan/LPS O-acetylase OafA/YrhL
MKQLDRSLTPSRSERLIDRALWALFFVSIALTLFWALGPRPPGAKIFPHADKFFHAGAFAMILGSFLLAAVWRPGRGWGRFPAAAVPAVAMLIALGVLIEVIQGELLSRDAELLDVAAEVVGMAVALLIVRSLGWGEAGNRRSGSRRFS